MLLFPFHRERVRQVKQLELKRTEEIVKRFGLTDLSIFTEARYTRHPSLADLHSAFQDHPMSLEHFPTGSIVSVRTIPFWRADGLD
ncbi:MAG: hypothetical protein D6710_09755 [Nitrospirae bacterium]|nr:MAG: hypothetical protein D6710_09755 [Nitrospirota bacterium]